MSALVKIRDIAVNERKLFLAKMCHSYTDKITKQLRTIKFPVKITDGCVNIPLGYIFTSLNRFIVRPPARYDIPVDIILRPEQKILYDTIMACKSTSIGIEVKPGFGKTILALAIASTYNNVFYIFVHRKILLKQWQDEVEKFLPNNKNNIKILMINELDKTNIDGQVIIIDEVHLCLTKRIYPVLACKYPALMIGMSATFYKNNEEQAFLEWFFPLIERVKTTMPTLSRKIKVIATYTNIKPDIIFNTMGKVDWCFALKSLSFNNDRNKKIVEKIIEHRDKNMLVLVKFIKHADIIADILKTILPEKSCCICYGEKEIDRDASVFISTYNKMGTGISLNKLNCLILAIDVKNYAIQYFGRVMREKDRDALIIDFIDNNNILNKHYNEREKIYKDMSAEIEIY